MNFAQATDHGPFRKTLLAFPITDVKPHLEHGDKVLLPDSLLHELMNRDIHYPMLFKLQVKNSKAAVYCSVSEFTAKEGQIVMPQWMMTQLDINRGAEVELFYVMLQKGTFVTLRPHTYKFVERHLQPERVLESHLNKYATLTRGTTVQIMEGGEVYYFDIVALKPARAVCILDTDIKLDLDEPLDIKEYEGKMKKNMEEKLIEDKFAHQTGMFNADKFEAQAMAPTMTDMPMSPMGDENSTEYTNIFAENSDEEENQSLNQKFGNGGYSIQRNAVNHTVASPKPAALTPVSSTTGKKEDEDKKKRDDLVRQQRAALFAARFGKPTAAPVVNSEAAKVLGTDHEQQAVVDIIDKKNIQPDLTTTVEGDWLVYRDQLGRLVKREPVAKGFAMTGIGNTIKK